MAATVEAGTPPSDFIFNNESDTHCCFNCEHLSCKQEGTSRTRKEFHCSYHNLKLSYRRNFLELERTSCAECKPIPMS